MIDSLFDILAQAASTAPAAPKGSGGLLSSQLIFPLVMIVIFYVILIRPQQKQRKELAKKVASLKTGDKVITAGGVHGMIHKVRDTTVTLKVDEGSYIEFEKTSIQTINPKQNAAK